MSRPRLFISYAHQPQSVADLAQQLHDALKDDWEVFLDKERIETGDYWRGKIFDELLGCHAAVVLLSPPALSSGWVRHEASFLRMRKHATPDFPLLPVMLDGVSFEDLSERGWEPLQLAELQSERLAADRGK